MKSVVFLLTLDTTVLGNTAAGTKLKFCRIYWKRTDVGRWTIVENLGEGSFRLLLNVGNKNKIQIVLFSCFHRIE